MMKQKFCLGTLVCLVVVAVAAGAEYYRLSGVRRVDQDLYRAGNIYIETRYCYHYTYGEDAVFKYEGPGEYSGNKIIWDDESSCDVKGIWKR